MARRGRPPREDGRTGAKVRINATQEELARIVTELTPDERRRALLYWIAIAEPIKNTPIHDTV